MVFISSNNVEFNVNEVLPAMNQIIYSVTTSERLFMQETFTVTGEEDFPNSLSASPEKSSRQTENFLTVASPMKSPEKLRNLENQGRTVGGVVGCGRPLLLPSGALLVFLIFLNFLFLD